MEKLEYIESKLEKLTSEFKNSIIIGEDNKETTFENYLRGYVLDTMNDDFTFGTDDIVNNVETLIMLHSQNTGIYPQEVELPKINKNHIRENIYDYIREKGYQKYLDSFMDYNDELFGTLKSMIEEFLIPNIDDYGNITEFGRKYPFRKFIDLKVEDHIQKLAMDKEATKNAKKQQLEEKYQEYLNYPTNDIDSSLTTFKLFIEKLVNLMDDDECVVVMGRKSKIDRLLEVEVVKSMQKYETFQNVCQEILSQGKGTFDDFKRIALVTNASVPEGTIIDELLNGILSNLMSKLELEQIDELCTKIVDLNIRNKGILNRSIALLKGINVKALTDELDASEDILLISKKEILKKYAEEYDNTEEFTIESAKKIYEEFSALLDEFNALLRKKEISDSNREFKYKMENYRQSMKSRSIFEDEKESIVNSYMRLKNQMKDDSDKNLNDLFFAFSTIKGKIDDLKESMRNHIRISEKDRELLETMANTAAEIKKQIVVQEDYRKNML